MDRIHVSCKSAEWETPDTLFEKLNMQYRFTLDPCCTHVNAKCVKHYTIEEDGLSKDWSNDVVFMNPPYGREIHKWVKKAYDESKRGAVVICLIPARTDTSYWHKYIFGTANICFLRGRLRFINRTLPSYREDGNFRLSPAPFPCAIVCFNAPTFQTT